MPSLRSLALLTTLSASLIAQPDSPVAQPQGEARRSSPSEGGPILTLEDCIARALKKNFDLEIQRFGPDIARDSVEIARSAFIPEFTVSTSRSMSRTAPDGSSLGTRAEGADTRVSVTQRFATGTTATVSTRLNRSESNPSFSTLNPAFDADLTVSLRQNLLRGLGPEVNRAAIERSRLGVDVANLTYKGRVLDVVQSTENAFYNLSFAREQLTVRRFSLALADRLYEEAKTRRDTGVATDLDVLQAEVGVANARRGVILAEQSVKDRQEQLLALIGQFELDAEVGAMQIGEVEKTLPVFAFSYNLAKQNQPDLQAQQIAVEQLKLDLLVAKDGAKPSLSVGGSLGFSGADRAAGNAISDTFERDAQSWQFDLTLTYPWGQVSDRARLRQSLAGVSREQLRLRQLEQNIEVQVRAAVRAVETSYESYQISAMASALSLRQYELEKARFDAGLSTSRRVLEAQNDLENARISELQSLISLRSARTALQRLEGSSLQRYGIQLQ
jgi:outer membrane protein TolC